MWTDATVKTLQYLYHVTSYCHLRNIAKRGLLPRKSDELNESARRWLYFTVAEGLAYWFNTVALFGVNPVVLRVAKTNVPAYVNDERGCFTATVIDEYGTRDAEAEAFQTRCGVHQRLIQVWTGREWVSVREWQKVEVGSHSRLLPPEAI